MLHVTAGVGGSKGQVDLDADGHALSGALHEVFATMDTDGTGTVDKDEMNELLLNSGITMKEGQLEETMLELDQEGMEGQVDFSHFAQWMLGGNDLAMQLRHHWKSSILGGNTFEDLVDDDDLAEKNRMHNGYSRWVFWAEDLEGNRLTGQSIWIMMEEPETSKGALLVSLFIQILIFISSVIFISDTIKEWNEDKTFRTFADISEFALVGIFTVEYVIRVATCTCRPGKDQGFVSYVTAGMNVVDLFAILPTYIELVIGKGEGGGLAVLRILRMARIIRVVKVGTFKENLLLVIEGLHRSLTGLILLVYLVLIFMVVMASVMFMLEADTDPCDVITARTDEENYALLGRTGCSTFVDIPHTFWFVIVTMTSVGYGDMFPYSNAGRAIGAVIMLSGILTLAVPITLISNKFNNVWLEAKAQKRKEQTIQELIHGTNEDDFELEDKSGFLTAIESRIYTGAILMKQSYQFSSDVRFACAMQILDTQGAGREDCLDAKARRRIVRSLLEQSFEESGDEKFKKAMDIFEDDVLAAVIVDAE